MLIYYNPNGKLIGLRLQNSEFNDEVVYHLILVDNVPDALSEQLYPSDSHVFNPIDDEFFSFESSSTASKHRLKEKVAPNISALKTSFKTVDVSTRSFEASQTSVLTTLTNILI